MDCYICGQIAGDSSNDLLAELFGGAYRRRIPVETQDFVAISSIGAITVGHTLVCPVGHLRRLADMSDGVAQEYIKFRTLILGVIRSEFGENVHIFEHGSDASGRVVPCTVEHAHLHVVPMDTSIRVELPTDLRWLKVNSDPAGIAAMVGDGEYLYYEAPDGTTHVALPYGVPFQSQLLRRILCAAIGREAWNWREDPALPLVSETERRLREGFERFTRNAVL